MKNFASALAVSKLFLTFAFQHGAISSVGRAPDCGSGCRGFEPHIAPQLIRAAFFAAFFVVPLSFTKRLFAVRGSLAANMQKNKKRGLERPLENVGMIRLERTTPTSRTWCASQLRYIPKKINLPEQVYHLSYASLLI